MLEHYEIPCATPKPLPCVMTRLERLTEKAQMRSRRRPSRRRY